MVSLLRHEYQNSKSAKSFNKTGFIYFIFNYNILNYAIFDPYKRGITKYNFTIYTGIPKQYIIHLFF